MGCQLSLFPPLFPDVHSFHHLPHRVVAGPVRSPRVDRRAAGHGNDHPAHADRNVRLRAADGPAGQLHHAPRRLDADLRPLRVPGASRVHVGVAPGPDAQGADGPIAGDHGQDPPAHAVPDL